MRWVSLSQVASRLFRSVPSHASTVISCLQINKLPERNTPNLGISWHLLTNHRLITRTARLHGQLPQTLFILYMNYKDCFDKCTVRVQYLQRSCTVAFAIVFLRPMGWTYQTNEAKLTLAICLTRIRNSICPGNGRSRHSAVRWCDCFCCRLASMKRSEKRSKQRLFSQQTIVHDIILAPAGGCRRRRCVCGQFASFTN